MQKQEIDDNLIFYPQVKLGKIYFSYQEKDIIQVLGKPNLKEKDDDYSDNSYVIRLVYSKLNISFFLHFEQDSFNYLSIHTDDLILNKTKLSSFTSKTKLIKHIKKYCDENGLIGQYSKTKDMSEECYLFDKLSLTIWFEQDIISDICIQK